MSSRSSFLGLTGGAAGVAALLIALLARSPQKAPSPPQPAPAASKLNETAAPLHADDLLRAALGGEYTRAVCGGDTAHPYDFDVLIAVVPDPVRSRLDWMYDVELEAVRRAHAADGYVLSQFWLPWDPSSGGLRDGSRDSFPGVMLFRRSGRGVEAKTKKGVPPAIRLVYVVGEMPAGGVDLRAMRLALRERAAVGAAGPWSAAALDTIRVLGPSFSGSTESLARGLRSWVADPDTTPVRLATNAGCADRDTALTLAARARRDSAAHVVSGAATLAGNPAVLRAAGPAFHFEATVHSTEDYDRVLRAAVMEPMGIREDEIAQLQESGTEYGAQGITSDRSGGILRVSVPMNISAIRRETKNDGESPSAGSLLRGLPAARVGLPLRTGADGQEQPTPLSDLTPPVTSATLDEVVRTLRDHRVRAVGMRFTDVRDNLYLAGEVKRRMRDVQLFTYESNALYLHPDHNDVLNGMVVVSTYPLFQEAQDWAAMRAGARQSFPADAAEGTYNATLRLLRADSMMLDYAPPFTRGRHPSRPPVWVTVVGGRTMLPVRSVPTASGYALDARPPAKRTGAPPAGDCEIRRDAATPRDTAARGCGHRHDAEGAGVLSVVVLLVGVLALGFWSAGDWRRRMAEVDAGRPGSAADAWERERAVHTGALHLQREILLGLRICAAAGMLAPLAMLLWRASAAPWTVGIAGGLALLVWVLAIVLGVFLAWKVVERHHGGGFAYAWSARSRSGFERTAWHVELACRLLVIVLGVLYVGSVCWLVRDIASMDPGPFELLYHRVRHTSGGVSMLVPLMLTGAGMVAWASWHLTRLEGLNTVTAFEGPFLHVEHRDDAPLPLAKPVQTVRATLFLLLPRGQALGVAFLVLMLVGVVWAGFRPTLESTVLPRPGGTIAGFFVTAGILVAVLGVGAWLLAVLEKARTILAAAAALATVVLVAWFAVSDAPWEWVARRVPWSAFDALLRFGVLCSLAITVWGVYRLLALWEATRAMLRVLANSPLLTALTRLPGRVVRDARLTLTGRSSTEAVKGLADATWTRVRTPSDEETAALGTLLGADASSLQALLDRRESWHERVAFWGPGARADDLRILLSAMGTVWKREGDAERVARLRTAEPEKERVETLYAGYPPDLQTWIATAEDLLALLVVEYVQWVLGALHKLAIFLFFSLLLTTMLLSSYPFQPQSTAKMIFLGVLLATVGSILYVMTQANRDDVLSRISGTPPGEVTWDSSFVLNTLLVCVVPMLVLISSEFPEVRDALFSWLGPLMRSVTGG